MMTKPVDYFSSYLNTLLHYFGKFYLLDTMYLYSTSSEYHYNYKVDR